MPQENVRAAHELIRYIHSLYRQLKTLASRTQNAKRLVLVHQTKQKNAEDLLAETKARHTEMVLQAKEKENLLNLCEAEIKRRQSQLDEAKSNKEYVSLKDQIAGDRLRSDALAEEALSLAEKAEEFLPQVAAAQEAVELAKKGVEKAVKDLEELKPVVIEDSERIKKELKEKLPEVSRDLSGPFLQAIKNFGGEDGLAPVEKGCFCGSCRIQIPMRYVIDLCEGRPYLCGSCGRFLYLPKDFKITNED